MGLLTTRLRTGLGARGCGGTGGGTGVAGGPDSMKRTWMALSTPRGIGSSLGCGRTIMKHQPRGAIERTHAGRDRSPGHRLPAVMFGNRGVYITQRFHARTPVPTGDMPYLDPWVIALLGMRLAFSSCMGFVGWGLVRRQTLAAHGCGGSPAITKVTQAGHAWRRTSHACLLGSMSRQGSSSLPANLTPLATPVHAPARA
jgi:hypothetical protein